MNQAEENEKSHFSKRNDDLMLENAKKGLFIAQYFSCKNCFLYRKQSLLQLFVTLF